MLEDLNYFFTQLQKIRWKSEENSLIRD